MRYVMVFISLLVLFTGFTAGQADVTTGEIFAWYLVEDENYVAFGASDADLLFFLLNATFGCAYLHDWPPGETVQFHDVFTPSTNFLGKVYGPMVHAVWMQGDDPCADLITWGYGTFTAKVQDKPNAGFSIHGVVSGFLPDYPDWCKGDLLKLHGVNNDKNGHGARIQLSCRR